MEDNSNVKRNSSKSEEKDAFYTSQVFEYFKNYSQNPELPKYFCGISPPTNVKDCYEDAQQPLSNITEIDPTDSAVHNDNVGTISSASSITSNRKLEWDSGADIGYNNISKGKLLQKSTSLPILPIFSDLGIENSQKTQCKLKQSTLNTSESTKSSKENHSALSTAYIEHKCQYITDLECNSENNKPTFLLPIAESTPQTNSGATSCSGSSNLQTEKLSGSFENISPSIKDNRIKWHSNIKVPKLSFSQPVVVECCEYGKNLGVDKFMQTSLPKNVSISIQTSLDFGNYQDTLETKNLEQQGVFYIYHSDDDKEASTSSNGVVSSNCNSFEFLPIENFNKEASSLSTSTSEESDLALRESPLAHLLNNGNSDLQKVVQLLLNVLKSKKYDSITKKHYLKKIIVNIGKSLSSGSEQSVVGPSSSKSVAVETIKPSKLPLQKNLQIHTFTVEILPQKSPKIDTEDIKCLQPNENSDSNEAPRSSSPIPDMCVPEEPLKLIGTKKRRLQRNHLLTLTNRNFSSNENESNNSSITRDNLVQHTLDSKKPLQKPLTIDVVQPTFAHSDLATLNQEQKDWRNDKTLSEQRLEQNIGDFARKNDHLLHFAAKEREHQLNWINNEISQLNKLKSLLEYKYNHNENIIEDIQKPHIEDMSGVKKSTSVYVLTTKKKYNQRSPSPSTLPSCICENSTSTSASDKIENEKLNLANAHLVSTDKLTSTSDNVKRNTVIRRYTFELPLQTGQDRYKKVTLCEGTHQQKAEAVSTDYSSSKESKKCCSASSQCKKPQKCTSTSSESNIISSSTSTLNLCRCCKKTFIPSSCSDEQSLKNEKQVLCNPCHNKNQMEFGTASYLSPGHTCNCYNFIRTDTLNEIKKTIQKLDDLETDTEYRKSCSSYCSKCKCKLKSQKKKEKGMAYVLTFNSDDNTSCISGKHKKKKHCSLEEVRFKLPSQCSKKSSKSCESDESNEENCVCKIKKHKCKKKKKSNIPTLHDYLCANKPSFITAAEQRRQCLINLAYMREQRCQKYKQLLAMTTQFPSNISKINADDKKKQQMFTTKEMKEITARNYKKCSEVQQKLENTREKQIKVANKVLADIFNQKLREKVLRGKHTLPINTTVIKLN